MKNGNKPEKLENRLLRDFCGCPILSQLSMCKTLQFMDCICFGVKDSGFVREFRFRSRRGVGFQVFVFEGFWYLTAKIDI